MFLYIHKVPIDKLTKLKTKNKNHNKIVTAKKEGSNAQNTLKPKSKITVLNLQQNRGNKERR